MLRPILGALGEKRCRLTHRVALCLFATILYLGVRPAYADVAVGSNSGSFLQFEVGGRPSGMGGAQVASAAGIMAQYWNPAALAALDQPQIGAMHAAWLDDLKYEWLGYARPMSPKLGVGSLSLAYFHLPSIQGVDAFGNPTGEFKVYDMALTAGLARNLGRGISVGANLKAIRQNLATVSAMGPALDLGVMALWRETSFGVVAQNLGPSLSFDGSTSYPLPRQYRLGVSRGFLDGRILMATDYNMPSNYYNDVRVGTELRAHPNISLRLGYRHEFGAGDDPANGMSYGLGINFRQLNVDYAMTPSNDFADVHRLSFGYSFGSGPTEKAPKPKPKKPQEKKPAPPAPTGPPVIAKAEPKPVPPPAPVKAAEETPKVVAASPIAPPAPNPEANIPMSQASPQPAPAPAPPPVAQNETPSEFVVVLPGFSSKESAQAEIKALELLGFRTKDAHIEKDPKRGGYAITLQRMKSKGKADDLASSLQRMSFRAVVDLAQK
jgi:uncharacterized protein UPF0164